MNTPVSISSLAADLAYIKSSGIKNSTDYYVSIVVTKDSNGNYKYSYFVRFKYCNMYTIFGILTNNNGDAYEGSVIEGVYLCDGRLFNASSTLPYVIKGYSANTDGSLKFTLSTFLGDSLKDLYIKVNKISRSDSTILFATYKRIPNTLEITETKFTDDCIYPIIIESIKQGSPCYVNVFVIDKNNKVELDGGKKKLNKAILPEIDTDMSSISIPCLIIG